MKNKISLSHKLTICLALILGLTWYIGVFAYAEDSTGDFVDLVFNLNSKGFTSKNVVKSAEEVPFVSGSTVMMPLKSIFVELGYSVNWNPKDKSLVVSRGNNSIKVISGSGNIIINGAVKKLDSIPIVKNGVLMGSLSIVSLYSGASAVYDEKAKSISITRTGKFDTGSVLLYEKTKNRVFIYDGNEIKICPLENKEIVNWYCHKGKILLTIFDKSKNKNNFAMFKNNNFQILIDDFDIKEAFTYNDNLIIHGYDRNKKINNLYRFDGTTLRKIADNFYVGKHIIFKDKLVINKYDNTRNYTLVVFDKNSWGPSVLSNGFIIKNTLDCGELLFMTGIWQSGSSKPLASYDGKTISTSSFEIVNNDIDIDLDKTVLCNSKLYAIIKSELTLIEKNSITNIRFPVTNTATYIKYTVGNIKSYNDTLYVSVTRTEYVDAQDKAAKNYKTDNTSRFVLEVKALNSTRILVNNINVTEFRVENNKLIILGTDISTKDPVLYIYNGKYLNKTLDVTSIKNTIALKDKLFIDIKDRDRITNNIRNTVLIYDISGIKNLILGMDMKKWSVTNDILVFAGLEEDIKKNKVYAYRKKFVELLGSYEVRYWSAMSNKVFISGYNPNTMTYSFYKIVSGNKIKIRDNIEVINMIKAKGSYYLIYSYYREPKSPLNGRKILYIYSDANKKFIEMKTDLELADMIFMK